MGGFVSEMRDGRYSGVINIAGESHDCEGELYSSRRYITFVTHQNSVGSSAVNTRGLNENTNGTKDE